jgi:hypothetical protein
MTLQQLERRLIDLERQVAELKRDVQPLRPLANMEDTFGMFANDAEFDDVVRLGREYRDQANADVDA